MIVDIAAQETRLVTKEIKGFDLRTRCINQQPGANLTVRTILRADHCISLGNNAPSVSSHRSELGATSQRCLSNAAHVFRARMDLC